VRKTLFLVTCLCLSVSGFAGRPKIGPGLSPGINDGEGNETGGNTKTEVALPVGLPVAGDETAATVSDPNVSSNIVYTFDLNDEEGAASVNQTHSALERAKDMNAACVLIRINSFAGGWDVAENIRQEIISYDRPVMVYVNNQAVPAASFISTGADSIYTKKGSTISNQKSFSNQHNSKSPSTASQESSANSVSSTVKSNSNPDALYSNDVTMNEILYKAGLGNLTVVQHQAGFSERAIDLLMNPWIVMCVLLLMGFVMRRTAKGKLPGPLLYALAVMILLYLAPFQLAGLANGGEIIASIALIIAVIVSTRYNMKWLTGIFLIALTFMFALVRAGDTDILLRYSSFSELVTLPSIPLGLVILGWWLGKIGESKRVRDVSNDQRATATFATS
jgi:hypothetical protein